MPIRLLLAAGALLALGSAGTLAYWNDTATVSSAQFQSGSLDLQVDGQAVGLGVDYSKNEASWEGFTPGESKAFSVQVTNAGDAPGRLDSTVRQSQVWSYVANPIRVRLFEGQPSNTASYPLTGSCSGAPIGGEVAATPAEQALIAPELRVDAGQSRALCLLVSLAVDADTSEQGKTGGLDVRFTLTQAAS